MGATLGQVGNPAGSVCVSELCWLGNSQDKPSAHRDICPAAGAGAVCSLLATKYVSYKTWKLLALQSQWNHLFL